MYIRPSSAIRKAYNIVQATLRQWFYKDEYMERLGRMPAVFDKDPDQQVVHVGGFEDL